MNLPMATRPLAHAHATLRAVDLAFADTLRRRDREQGCASDETVLLAAALASLAIGLGHAAFDPAQPRLLLDDRVERDWPDAEEWQAALRQSRWVATPDAGDAAACDRPLVLEGGLLYLRRYREYERRLAAGLRRIAAHPPTRGADATSPPDRVLPGAPSSDLFTSIFPGAAAGDLQAQAATSALSRALLLVTGGPGTGKTTTIARTLLLLVAQAHASDHPPPRIALAAPTGRAAERIAESLRRAVADLRDNREVDARWLDALPTEASTLHRLLGTIPDSPQFRHHAGNPLPFDVVVVDEASMVDLPLMCKLVEAVASGARLILLGDRDQLPSVEAGDVLAAIDDAADDAASDDPAHALAGHRVRLQRGYRQSVAFDLAPLAAAARDGDADAVLALLRGGTLTGVHFHEDLLDPLAGATLEPLLAGWRALAETADPAEALALATRVRLLTALRDGPQGAHPLNARIEEALAGAHRPRYFPGRLLLVTENSYRHGLFNGDIGVCLRSDDGATVAWFAGGAQGVRGFHPAALPAHDGAFAMTVHKAQGSEFDQVWLQLPRQDARSVSRELLYTAITRARQALHLCASEAVLRGALARRTARVSGLGWRLRDAD